MIELRPDGESEISAQEMQAFDRTLAMMEWLLAILVLLYIVLKPRSTPEIFWIMVGLVPFVLLVLILQYAGLQSVHSPVKMQAETLMMVALITWVLFVTRSPDSPFVHLYLIVVIASALTLPKRATLLLVLVIFCGFCLVHLSAPEASEPLPPMLGRIVITFFPVCTVAYFTSMLADELQISRAKVHKLAQVDDLTGCWNMRMFNQLMLQESRRSLRYARSFSVVMLDADNLKTTNDIHGHHAGSSLIQAIGCTLRDSVRSSDIVARFGGDEFILLLPETSSEAAASVADRLRLKVGQTGHILEGRQLPLSISLGVAGFPEHGQTIEEVTRHADEALYLSKRAGKNRTTLFQPPDSAPAAPDMAPDHPARPT